MKVELGRSFRNVQAGVAGAGSYMLSVIWDLTDIANKKVYELLEWVHQALDLHKQIGLPTFQLLGRIFFAVVFELAIQILGSSLPVFAKVLTRLAIFLLVGSKEHEITSLEQLKSRYRYEFYRQQKEGKSSSPFLNSALDSFIETVQQKIGPLINILMELIIFGPHVIYTSIVLTNVIVLSAFLIQLFRDSVFYRDIRLKTFEWKEKYIKEVQQFLGEKENLGDYSGSFKISFGFFTFLHARSEQLFQKYFDRYISWEPVFVGHTAPARDFFEILAEFLPARPPDTTKQKSITQPPTKQKLKARECQEKVRNYMDEKKNRDALYRYREFETHDINNIITSLNPGTARRKKIVNATSLFAASEIWKDELRIVLYAVSNGVRKIVYFGEEDEEGTPQSPKSKKSPPLTLYLLHLGDYSYCQILQLPGPAAGEAPATTPSSEASLIPDLEGIEPEPYPKIVAYDKIKSYIENDDSFLYKERNFYQSQSPFHNQNHATLVSPFYTIVDNFTETRNKIYVRQVSDYKELLSKFSEPDSEGKKKDFFTQLEKYFESFFAANAFYCFFLEQNTDSLLAERAIKKFDVLIYQLGVIIRLEKA
jgi:hypothetical protein